MNTNELVPIRSGGRLGVGFVLRFREHSNHRFADIVTTMPLLDKTTAAVGDIRYRNTTPTIAASTERMCGPSALV